VTAFSPAEMTGRIANAGPMDHPLRLRTERCDCGVEIVADVRDPGPEVLRHNRTTWHRGWWRRVERE